MPILFALIIGVLLLVNSLETEHYNYRRDPAEIEVVFPLLKNVEQTAWKSNVFSRLPYPDSWYAGFIIINAKQCDYFHQNYDWMIIYLDNYEAFNEIFSPIDINVPNENLIWYNSEKFDEEMMESFAGNYSGDFYMDFEKELIFFKVSSS